MKRKRYYAVTAFCILVMAASLWSQSMFVERVNASRYIRGNKDRLRFLNTLLSNFGGGEDSDEGKLYAEAKKKDYEANSDYLQLKYKDAYTSIKESLRAQIRCYEKIIQTYLDDTKKILNDNTRRIVDSDRKVAKENLQRAFAMRVTAMRYHKKLKGYVLDPEKPKAIHARLYGDIIRDCQGTITSLRRSKHLVFESIKEMGYVIPAKYNKDRTDIVLEIYKDSETVRPHSSDSSDETTTQSGQ